jgi:nucleoside-diphosphate-sugar epimerase
LYDGTAGSVLKAVQVARPEAVFHLAALFIAEHKFENIPALFESNVTFATELVDAMIQSGCRNLVCAGTAWQNFNGQHGTPSNLYAATKEAFEAVLRFYVDAHGLHATTLKIYDTYGLGDPRKKLLSVLREAVRTGESLKMSPGEQEIDLLNVQDAIDAFILTAQQQAKEKSACLKEYYLRSGEVHTLKQIVDMFAKITAKPLQVEWGSRPYRDREVMKTWKEGEVLPGWKAKIKLANGLKEFGAEQI